MHRHLIQVPKIACQKRQSLILILVVFILASCSHPVSLKSTLRERVSRTPESASSLGDGDTNIGTGRFKEELSRFNSAQNIPDSDAQFYFLKGELLLSKDKFEEALISFKQSERRLPSPSATLSKRIIQIYLREGDLAQATSVAESYHKKLPADQQISEAIAREFLGFSLSAFFKTFFAPAESLFME